MSDAELLRDLRRFARQNKGRAFTVRQYLAWPQRRYGQKLYFRRFGTWREALGRIGLDGVAAGEYSAAEMVGEVERLWRILGRAPGVEMLHRYGRISKTAYLRRWGSLRRCCDMIERYRRKEITREQLLAPTPESWDRWVPVDTRWEVLKRDGRRCVVCGRSPANEAAVVLQVDHIVPVMHGGSNAIKNLRTLCHVPNLRKYSFWP